MGEVFIIFLLRNVTEYVSFSPLLIEKPILLSGDFRLIVWAVSNVPDVNKKSRR